jgi:hypothetical protein
MHAAFLLLRALRSSSSYTSGFGHDSHALALVACLGFGSLILRFLPRSFIVICVLQSDMAATTFRLCGGIQGSEIVFQQAVEISSFERGSCWIGPGLWGGAQAAAAANGFLQYNNG